MWSFWYARCRLAPAPCSVYVPSSSSSSPPPPPPQETKRKALANFNLPELIASVRDMTDGIMRTALDYGFLQGVELPPMSVEELVQREVPPPPATPTPSGSTTRKRA